MNAGRPPQWNVFADAVPGVWSELIEVTSKNRLGLSANVRRRLSWIEAVRSSGLLASIGVTGEVELNPWISRGHAAVEALCTRLNTLDEPAKSDLALALMDSYAFASVDSSLRLALPTHLLSYLDPAGRGSIRVNVLSDRLWLVNEEIWQGRRAMRAALIDQIA